MSVGYLALGAAIVAGVAKLTISLQKLFVVNVEGTSMRPTFDGGDRLLARRCSVRRLRSGTVVILRNQLTPLALEGDVDTPPNIRFVADEMKYVVKRIAALPGQLVPESVLQAVDGMNVVPDGMLVVLGDNSRSRDSRHWGFVPLDDVCGIVVRKLSETPVRSSESETTSS